MVGAQTETSAGPGDDTPELPPRRTAKGTGTQRSLADPTVLTQAEQAALAIPRTATARGTGLKAVAPAKPAKVPAKVTKPLPVEPRPVPRPRPIREVVSPAAKKTGWNR